VQLRDDKSFPYILITGDHWAPQISSIAARRRGRAPTSVRSRRLARSTAPSPRLQRAFLIRSCTDAFFESRTRPCLLYQIKRCSGPCTGEIDFPGYTELVREAKEFLSGRSRAVKQLARRDGEGVHELEFERAALYRDRLAALSAIQSQQGINPRTVEEADVFAIHQEGGYSCVEVFFFRTGQNWGNRAYFPRADRSCRRSEVLGAFLAQFYDDKPAAETDPALARDAEERDLLAEALSTKAGFKVEVACRSAGRRKTSSRMRSPMRARRSAASSPIPRRRSPAAGAGDDAALPRTPRRIEVYDNSHIQGTNAVGAMIVAGPEGFAKNQYRKFNIRSRPDARRRLRDDARSAGAALQAAARRRDATRDRLFRDGDESDDDITPKPWPDLVIIDGGMGQLNAARRQVLGELGVSDVR
jgi:excinuclease ABC subunit C